MEFAHTNRVVILVDMDCFYCQVEENLDPGLSGKPIAVVQYIPWQGGGIIAVNYPARDKGVTRYMRGNEAKAKCPEINLVSVPCVRGKADISRYRDAGKKVADVLQTFTDLLERASVDEAYLDVTNAVNSKIENYKCVTINQLQNTHVVGYSTEDFLDSVTGNDCLTESNLKLLIGGIIAEEIREAVYKKTGYKCSAGIAHNKILAKLACGMHKPNQQTILPQDSVQQLYENLPVKKIRSLGGKFGHEVTEDLGIKTMSELVKFSEKELVQRYDEKTGTWLYKIARGIDLEPVTIRLVSKSIGCCKKFPGRTALIHPKTVIHWLNELAEEISERLEKDTEENNRRAKQMVVSFLQEINREDISGSRTYPLNSHEPKKIAADAFEVIKKNCLRADGTFHLKFLGISATRFEDNKNVPDISSYFITTKAAGDNSEVKSKLDEEKQVARKNTCDIASFIKNMGKAEETIELQHVDSKNESNSSIFSTETEIISGDEEQENHPPMLKEGSHHSESDADSITDEMFYQEYPSAVASTSKQTPVSYFTDFFDNFKDEKPKSPAERNFNTSRYLEEENSESETIDSIPNKEASAKEINFDLSNSDSQELCQECNKRVPKCHFVSHTDYHFALKLVQEEAHTYQQQQNKSKSKPAEAKKRNSSENKSTKRKHIHEKCLKLTSFLKAANDVNDAGETCAECNRKIPVGEMLNHMDYHMAKKLHLQINPVKTCEVQNLKVSRKKPDAKSNNIPSEVRVLPSLRYQRGLAPVSIDFATGICSGQQAIDSDVRQQMASACDFYFCSRTCTVEFVSSTSIRVFFRRGNRFPVEIVKDFIFV